MKVLLVNVNGIAGSTGKIVTDTKAVLEHAGHECIVAYGANGTIHEPGYNRICSETERKINAAIGRLTGVLYGIDLPFSFRRLKKLIEAYKPDIVHLHCPNGYILNLFDTLQYLAKKNIKTVITNHAEFYYTGGCGHAYDCDKWLDGCRGKCSEPHGVLPIKPASYTWQQFKRAFDLFKLENIVITSVSPWLTDRAAKSPALGRFRHVTVLNGLDTSVFHPTTPTPEVMAKLPDKYILHVSAQFTTRSTNKGGQWICELARRLPDVKFVVASSYTGAIENLPENIMLWGRTKNQQELAMLYTVARATVITSYRETFSMVTAESLCCGTPVAGFKAGGPESIGLPEYSRFVDYGNVEALKDALVDLTTKDYDKQPIAELAQRKYAKEVMGKKYNDLYWSLLK